MAKNRKSIILALDISSNNTGYAVLRNGRWNKSGASFGHVKVPTDLSLPKRLVLFRDALARIIRAIKPTDIIIEDVFSGRNIATMKLLARFNGVAVELCRRTIKKDPIIALAAEVRAGIGCGRSKKEAFEYIQKRYNLDWSFNKMNDVTDALMLALYGYKVLRKV